MSTDKDKKPNKETKYSYGKPLLFFDGHLLAIIYKFLDALKSAFVKR